MLKYLLIGFLGIVILMPIFFGDKKDIVETVKAEVALNDFDIGEDYIFEPIYQDSVIDRLTRFYKDGAFLLQDLREYQIRMFQGEKLLLIDSFIPIVDGKKDRNICMNLRYQFDRENSTFLIGLNSEEYKSYQEKKLDLNTCLKYPYIKIRDILKKNKNFR